MTPVKALQAFHLMRQGAVLAVAVLLAKSGLSTAEIGVYEKLLYIGFLLSTFWVSGLAQGLLSLYPRLDSAARPGLLWDVYLFFLGLAGLTAFLCLGAKRIVLTGLISAPDLPYFDLFIAYLVLQLPAYLLENYYLLHERPWANFWFGVVSSTGYILAIVAPPWLGMPFQWSFYGLIVLALIKHAWLLLFLFQSGRPVFNRGLMTRWLVLSWPLVGYALIAGINQSLDSWLISFRFPGQEHLFAVYRYGARELPFALAMTQAFTTALIPVIAGDLERGMDQLKNKSRKLFHLLFPPSILLMLTSWWLFPVIFNQVFSESVLIFNIFILILVSRLVFSRSIMIALGDNKASLWILLAEVAAHLLLSSFLLTWFGLAGAAWGTLLAYTLEKVLASIYLYRKHGIPVGKYLDISLFIGYSTVLIIAFAGYCVFLG